MNKRTLLNLGLLVVIGGLGLVAWLKPGIKKPVVQPPLTALKAAAIHSIRIDRQQSGEVRLQRQGAKWEMLAPRQLPADEFLIKAMLGNLASPTVSHFKLLHAELDRYGLAKPQIRLYLNDTEIDFGATEPLEGNRYVKIGDTVFLTDGSLFYRLNHDALWWIDKQLLPAHAQITAIQLPNATLTLNGGKWHLQPANPDVTSDAIQKLVDAWHDARAVEVAKPGKGKSRGDVAIELAGRSEPVRFEILANSGFLVLLRPDLGVEYRLDNADRKSLLELQAKPPKKSAAGHNGAKESQHARTAGSRNHAPGR